MTDKPPAPAQQPEGQDPDIQQRIEGFNNELRPILGKYELGLAALPSIVDGKIIANPILISMRGQPQEPESNERGAKPNPSAEPAPGLSKVD